MEVQYVLDHMFNLYPVTSPSDLLLSDKFMMISNVIAGIINQCDWISSISQEFAFCNSTVSLDEYKQ